MNTFVVAKAIFNDDGVVVSYEVVSPYYDDIVPALDKRNTLCRLDDQELYFVMTLCGE